MSGGFDAILKKALGKLPKKASQKALWEQSLEAKTASLKGTIKLRTDEDMTEETLEALESAAEQRVEDLMLGVVANDIWDLGKKVLIRNSGKLDVPATHGLQDATGTNISAINLTKMLNLTLHTYIERLMGKRGRLVNRTGRFANSVEVNRMTFSSKLAERKHASVYFNYMIAPYAVFGKGGKQYSEKRDPSTLIDTAIKEAFKRTLSATSYKMLRGQIHTEREDL